MALFALFQLSIVAAVVGWAAHRRRARRDQGPDPRAAPAEAERAALAEAQRTARLGSYAIDLATEELASSEELRHVLGLGAEPLTSSTALLSHVHPDDRNAVFAAWEEAKAATGAVSVEHRIVNADGATRWIDGRVRAVPDPDGGAGRLIGTMQDVSDRRAVESALAHQALHDPLTGLPNRAALLGRLAQVMAQRQHRPSGLAVFFLDIDRFKWINDSRGHAAGDELLLKIGRRLKASMRPGDTVARFGGDEFVVLCEDVPAEKEALLLADRLASMLRRPVDIGGGDTTITVSIGITYLAADDLSITSEALVRDADSAMYEAKEAGRDRHQIFDAHTRLIAATRIETVEALRRGVTEGEFLVHYQPIVDLVTRRLVGFEALVRWDRPGWGLLPPADFLELAEETGLMIPIGADGLRTACHQVGAWHNAPRPDALAGGLSVSVNLGRRQLLDPALGDVVRAALTDAGLLPRQLHVEVAESVLLSDADAAARALGQLRNLGLTIAVDGFGTCFSSLNYLKQLPVDVLKIDPSLVQGLGREREDRAIVAGVIDVAHAFGLTTVAEGVETLEQLDELRTIGCLRGQGHLWSRALPADEAGRWLAQHEAACTAAAVEGRAAAHDLSSSDAARVVEEGRRVLLVDDDRTYRQILRLIVESGSGFHVVGEAEDGREAIALARSLAPDIILLDLAMPGMGGLEALPLLLSVVPGAKVIVLSSLDPAYLMEQAGATGATAFCTKLDAPTTLLDALGPWIAV